MQTVLPGMPLQGVRSIADVVAIEATSIDEGSWPLTTYELIQHAADKFGSRSALTYLPDAKDFSVTQTYDFFGLLSAVNQTANLFYSLGIGAQDVVSYALPNVPQAHLALWGGEASGAAFALNALLAPAQLATLLVAGEAKVFVTTAAIWDEVRVLLTASSLKAVLLVDAPGADGSGVPSVLNFDEAISQQPSDRLISGRVVQASDRSSFFCTGGTTGLPKIAMRTHAGEIANAKMVQTIFNNPSDVPQTFFCGLPLHHVNASMNTGLVPWLFGHHVVLGTATGYRNSDVIENFWKIVEHFRITAISTVPTVLSSLLRTPVGSHDISSLERVVCGAAPMATALFERFQEVTGLRILEGYGLTEGMCVSTCNPVDGERKIGSIGLRLPWQKMRVVSLDADGAYERDCEPNEVGAIAISGPNVFDGYRSSDHNRKIWLDVCQGERWLNTGDLGRVDEDGYFWLTGRSKELIIRGGHNIDPAMIEEPLHRHPAVDIAAAVPRADAHAGEVPVAYVQLRVGCTATEEELLDYARTAITERAAVPKRIHIIPAIPLTVVGKIFKPALVSLEIESVIRHEAAVLGVSLESVTVSQDAKLGLVAEVVANSDPKGLKEALAQYTMNIRLLPIAEHA